MKTYINTVFLLLFPLLMFSQTLVSYDKLEGVDLSKFKTFQIYSLNVESIPEFKPKKEGLNLMLEEIIKQMTSRGFVKVKENPDLIINLGVSIIAKLNTRETDIYDAPYYMGQRNYHWESEEIVIGSYKEGTVTFDLVDNQNETMIWQVMRSGVLLEKIEKNKKRIIRGVKKMFKKFPLKQ